MVVVYWIRIDVFLFPYLWYIIKYSMKVPGMKNFKDGKETRIFLTRLVIL